MTNTAQTLAEAWTRLNGHVLWAHDADQAAAAVIEVIAQERAGLVVAHDVPLFHDLGLLAAIAAHSHLEVPPPSGASPLARQAFRQAAARAALGVAWAEAAVAASGTVVQGSSGRTPRLVSLLPPACLFVVTAASIEPDLASLFARRRAAGVPPALNLISGPSRTADIEGDLALGVHGPGRVFLLILEGISCAS